MAWVEQCKVTVLRLEDCCLAELGGRTLADALCLNTTVTSMDIGSNGLGEVGGLELAEALHLNSTVTSINLWKNALGEVLERSESGCWQRLS
jgi:Ran GTPase-activating protein (RanGAP) involved in mRNA processing and transport